MAMSWRWAMAAAVACGLFGCGPLYDSSSFNRAMTADGAYGSAAMMAVSKGDWLTAEDMGNRGLRQNARDPYALLALATVYQNTGRQELARQYYQSLASLHPQETAVIGSGPGVQRMTIEEIALRALASYAQSDASVLTGSGGGRDVAVYDPAQIEDNNIASRFRTLQRLRDDGLITRVEYDERRAANLGALLRYTVKRPVAAGLGQPAPDADQIIARLKTLGAVLEEKVISAAEQSAERDVILESLLPLKPRQKTDLATPITSQMEMAAAIGRIEKFYQAEVIKASERTRERDAVQSSYQAYVARAEMASRAAAALPVPTPQAKGPGVRLGSYGSEASAEKAWQTLQAQFPEQLSGLSPVISKVSARRGGAFWRLSAGPLADRKSAAEACRIIKRRTGHCEVVTLK